MSRGLGAGAMRRRNVAAARGAARGVWLAILLEAASQMALCADDVFTISAVDLPFFDELSALGLTKHTRVFGVPIFAHREIENGFIRHVAHVSRNEDSIPSVTSTSTHCRLPRRFWQLIWTMIKTGVQTIPEYSHTAFTRASFAQTMTRGATECAALLSSLTLKWLRMPVVERGGEACMLIWKRYSLRM